MHQRIRHWTGLIVLGAMLAGEAFADDTPRIEPAVLLKRIQSKDPSLLILDVRTAEEFAAGHVPGAINIPSTHFPARIAELSSDNKDVVIYCAAGIRAEHAATSLRENGFSRLMHLDGDMTDWVDSKRPVEK